MKTDIQIFDHANTIMNAVQTGVLLTTKAGDRVNSMTISWGTLGIEWARPIFTVFVRENRFTRSQLEKNPEFTVNIPHGAFDKKILGFCGTKSGGTVDKIRELGLTPVAAEAISIPGIRELPLTLECRVVYRQKQDERAIPEVFRKTFYPRDVDGSFSGSNRDYHTAYYGEIVRAYIIG